MGWKRIAKPLVMRENSIGLARKARRLLVPSKPKKLLLPVALSLK